MSIEPDTKDWTWVLQRRCPQCGFDAPAVTAGQVAPLVRSTGRDWVGVLATATGERPAPGVWSPLEYACHVLDVLRVFDGRLRLMLDQDDPVFASWDQDEAAVRGRYADRAPGEVAAELPAAAEVLADRFAGLDDARWARPGRRTDGASFTVLTFARYLLHDVVHHLHDVRPV